jgi:hypothetical protein
MKTALLYLFWRPSFPEFTKITLIFQELFDFCEFLRYVQTFILCIYGIATNNQSPPKFKITCTIGIFSSFHFEKNMNESVLHFYQFV